MYSLSNQKSIFKLKVYLLSFLFICVISNVGFTATSRKINYQGRLMENGAPVGDSIPVQKPLTFKLFDAESGGTELWSSGPQIVTVSKGLFNYVLGSNVPLNINWESGDIYLEITVDGTRLSPREQITNAGYAFLAENVVDGAITTDDIANNAVNSTKIADGSVTSADVANNSLTSSDLATNIVSSVDGVVNDGGNIDLVAGTNINITPNDTANTITISATGGGGGDTIADADGDTKVQTEETANEDKIRFDTAGSERMIIDSNGNVGIGTTDPAGKLTIYAPGQDSNLIIAGRGTSLSDAGAFDMLTLGDGTKEIGHSATKGWRIQTPGDAWGFAAERNDWRLIFFDGATASTKLFIEHDTGNVGIGGTLGVTGVATLGDSSQMATSAAPTADADLANKKYVDDHCFSTSYSFTWDPSSVPGGGSTNIYRTIVGMAIGDLILATFSLDVQGMILHAYVSSANNVIVVFYNPAAAAVDLGSGTCYLWMIER